MASSNNNPHLSDVHIRHHWYGYGGSILYETVEWTLKMLIHRP